MFYLKAIPLAIINIIMKFFSWPFVLIGLCQLMLWNPCGNFKRLPSWLAWFDTPDTQLPGDLTLPTVSDIYDKWGWFITSFYWLAIRNTFFGFSWQFGKPCMQYMSNMTEGDKFRWDVWEKVIDFKIFKLKVGWVIYRDYFNWFSQEHYLGFWAVPRITIRMPWQS